MFNAPWSLPVATGILATLFALQTLMSVRRGKEGSDWKLAMRMLAPIGFVSLGAADIAAFNSTSVVAVACYAGVTLVGAIVALALGSRYLQFLMAATGLIIGLFGLAAVLRLLYLLPY